MVKIIENFPDNQNKPFPAGNFMEILDSNVSLQSRHERVSFNYEKFEFRFITKNIEDERKTDTTVSTKLLKADLDVVNMDEDSMDEEEIKTFILRFLIEKLTGKKVKTVSLKELRENINSLDNNLQEPQFAAELKYEKLSYEKENVTFRANGKIVTKDGREIKFDVSFSINREVLDYTNLDIKAGSLALIDPLVVNLSGDLNNPLSDSTFIFDLDSDGVGEAIPVLSEGNGFLVFDKNENGIVDDGSELFGTKTGDGFGELSVYDYDKNGWIDESDRIFDKLKIWLKTESQDRLVSLKDANIGAIYLKGVNTPFSFGNGLLRDSSVYLKENEDAGIVSKVDFVV